MPLQKQTFRQYLHLGTDDGCSVQAHFEPIVRSRLMHNSITEGENGWNERFRLLTFFLIKLPIDDDVQDL